MKVHIMFYLLLFSVCTTYAQKKADKSFYERGVAKINKEDFEGAIMELNKAILVEPTHAGAYAKRAFAHAMLLNHESALLDYNKAIEIDPTDAQAHSNRAVAKLNLRDKEGACKDWQTAFSLGFEEANDFLIDFCQ